MLWIICWCMVVNVMFDVIDVCLVVLMCVVWLLKLNSSYCSDSVEIVLCMVVLFDELLRIVDVELWFVWYVFIVVVDRCGR